VQEQVGVGLSQQHVLIVDDEPGVRETLGLTLKRHGYGVSTAATAEEALDLLSRLGVDVVISDIRMPGMGGEKLLDRIIDEHPHVTVILMSAFGNENEAIEYIKKGAYDYISKPIARLSEVVLTLRKAEERERLKQENQKLRTALAKEVGFSGFLGHSAAMQRVFATVRKVADYKTTVLISGDSGTGKELVARALHNLSSRSLSPFVPVNCGAIPENLLESELFGHRRGAFTDASRDKKGLFEEANRGTLFLDEIGELPLGLQVKLLRVLQEETLRRLGDTHDIQLDVRVVAATVRNLEKATASGAFREDLFYRLNVIQIVLPPLRERMEDVPELAQHFLQRANDRIGRTIRRIHPDTLKLLASYDWPGNVRELENSVEHAAVLCDGEEILPRDLPGRFAEARAPLAETLPEGDLSIKRAARRIERDLIRRALTRTGGNRTGAAKLLEISHRALLYKMKNYEIKEF
jgi:two-component system, NtrC family, response regulator AtoC